MKGAILEILLVSAEGIENASFIGTPAYHVIIKCGTHIHRSKTSSGILDKVYWNEKFSLELTQSELKNLSHLKLQIVDEKCFSDGEVVGETSIYLKGIFVEGNHQRLVELNPSPYNVVLEDDTYKGQITIGLRFIPNIIIHMKKEEYVEDGNDVCKSICKTIVSLWRSKWWRMFTSYGKYTSINKLHKLK